MAPKTLTIARDIELQLTTKPLSTIPKNRVSQKPPNIAIFLDDQEEQNQRLQRR